MVLDSVHFAVFGDTVASRPQVRLPSNVELEHLLEMEPDLTGVI